MAHVKAPCLLLVTLASCLLLLQLTLPCVQAARLGPAEGLNRRSLIQQVIEPPATATNDSDPTNSFIYDIPGRMAPLAVLQLSLSAANMSNLAYPATLLTSNTDVENTYTDPAAFKLYADAVTNATSYLSRFKPTFVQRFITSYSHPEADARFLYAFVKPMQFSIHVAFRGTDLTGYFSRNAAISAEVDANTIQTPFIYNNVASGNVHSGIYKSLTEPNVASYDNYSYPNSMSAYQEIVAAIKAAQKEIKNDVQIVLSGHSLGAAQATLAAYMLTLDGFTNVFLFTFGSPQIGDAAWRAAFDAALGINQLMAVDWWNMEDPVVQVPNIDEDPGCDNSIPGGAPTCVQNWFTAGTRYRIYNNADGTLRCGQPTGSYAVCDNRANSTAPGNQQSCYTEIGFKDVLLASDHYITNYIANLQQCEGSTLAAAFPNQG